MLNTFKLLIANFAFMGMQLVLVFFLNYFYSLEASGSYFYTLAILSPLYLFFSLGARQLYLSGELKKEAHFTFRVLGMCFFAVAGSSVILFDLAKPLVVTVILLFKLYENIQDYKTADYMVDGKYIELMKFQVIRLLIFSGVLVVSGLYLEKWEYSLLLATFSIVIPSLLNARKVHGGALSLDLIKKGGYLGAGMFFVTLTVSLPKIEVEKYISLNAFGALQTLIYMCVIGQLVVNVIASKVTVITAKKTKVDSFSFISKVFLLLCFFIFLFLLVMYENVEFFFWLITSHDLDMAIKSILPLLFIYIFIALVGGFVEKFSSIFNVEKQHFKIYLFTLFLCVILTYVVIPSYKMEGYMYVLISISFLKMFFLIIKFYYESRR